MSKLVVVEVSEVELSPRWKLYELKENVTVKYKFKGKVISFVIEAGFKTDGATIPRIMWTMIGSPFQPRFSKASLCHDYQCKKEWDVKEMSELFYENLLLAGVNKWKAKAMYQSVYFYKLLF
jgi:hypothetical protein